MKYGTIRINGTKIFMPVGKEYYGVFGFNDPQAAIDAGEDLTKFERYAFQAGMKKGVRKGVFTGIILGIGIVGAGYIICNLSKTYKYKNSFDDVFDDNIDEDLFKEDATD